MSIRKSVVSGSFYPNDKLEVEKYFEIFHKNTKLKKDIDKIKAIIVPHAGYVYSGYTANIAYEHVALQTFKRIIIIGPSHRVYLKGASVSLYDEYETPLGNIKMDLEFSRELIEKYKFLTFNEECEFEHSTETQAPFIKKYFKNIELVEIIYGDCTYKDLSLLISDLLEDEENLVVISSDLSHFYTQKEANILDSYCLEAIEKKDLKLLNKGEACGKTGVEAILDVSINKDFKTKVLHYCTSADYSKDESRVVGYTSALVGV